MKMLLWISGIIAVLMLGSCYYDNMEELYPDSGTGCDTTQITFSGTVMPIMQSHCTGCHSGSAPAGNIPIENYDDVVQMVHNGSLMGSIRFEQGYSPMPKGGNKLSDCNITKLEMWIADGMLNN